MTSTRRSQFAAVGLFLLIATVVVGGMGWATVSTYKLARKNVSEEHERRISRAVLDMSSYMAGILNAETWRDPVEYSALYERTPVAAFGPDNAEVNAQRILLLSPLALSERPAKDWIDLYFQVDHRGLLTSPNILDGPSAWLGEHARTFPTPGASTRVVWEWLKTALLSVDLQKRIACACGLEPEEGGIDSRDTADVTARTASHRPAPDGTPADHESGYRERQRKFRESQAGYLPPVACIEAGIALRTARAGVDASETNVSDPAAATTTPTGEVEVSSDAITAFWLGEGPSGTQKLAFVREVRVDADTWYQGFVGDWSRLKPELLQQIQDPFPIADLRPALNETDDGTTEFDTAHMFNLPVRLNVPDFSDGASTAAWRKVRGTVLTMWLSAVAVLAVAGWGLRNLVALTERRMQFAYAVTHELRTPLTTFRLYSDMLSAGLVAEDAKQDYFDTLNRESIRLSSLVEGVLEYARLENQRARLSPTDTTGPALLAVVTETLNERCRENDIHAETENLLTNGQPLRTDVDVVNRIASVLVNNACRHARGNADASVLVRLGGTDGNIFLDVIDSGSGVDRADARAIFKPFRRGRRADENAQSGIGLGLSLAKNWATLLGGRLELAACHDPLRGGAHFRLTLPAVAEA